MSRIYSLEEISRMPRGELDGYAIRYLPKGEWRYKSCSWAFEHRLVMEAVLGRVLARKEDVHHENRHKQDNTPTNLEIKTKAEHQRGHVKRTGDWRSCVVCGNRYWRRAAHRRYRRRTCSRQCYWKTPVALKRRRRYEVGKRPDVGMNREIAALRAQGIGFREISRRLGIPITSCHNRFRWAKHHSELLRKVEQHVGGST